MTLYVVLPIRFDSIADTQWSSRLYTYPAGRALLNSMNCLNVVIDEQCIALFLPLSPHLRPTLSVGCLRVEHRWSGARFQVSSDKQGWSVPSALLQHSQSQQQKWWEKFICCRVFWAWLSFSSSFATNMRGKGEFAFLLRVRWEDGYHLR